MISSRELTTAPLGVTLFCVECEDLYGGRIEIRVQHGVKSNSWRRFYARHAECGGEELDARLKADIDKAWGDGTFEEMGQKKVYNAEGVR